MARVSKFERDFRAAFERHARCPADIDTALEVIRADYRHNEWLLELGHKVGLPGARPRHYRNQRHLKLDILDTLLGTHGVETLGDGRFEYLNVGDVYTTTLVWYRSSGRFYMRCYGSIVEAYRLK